MWNDHGFYIALLNFFWTFFYNDNLHIIAKTHKCTVRINLPLTTNNNISAERQRILRLSQNPASKSS